jgi:hypothetical protein
MIFLIALALLIAPPALIMALPRRWLKLAVPAGALGLYALTKSVADDFVVQDPGPAGILILGFFSLIFWINLIALAVRIILDLKNAA